jgi:hypothetical protein
VQRSGGSSPAASQRSSASPVEADSPDEAISFVRAELAMKLGDGGEGLWQADKPHLLPRWQMSSVRVATRVDEKGFPVE